MKFVKRAKKCAECPYREDKGHRLDQELYDKLGNTTVFPCHEELEAVTGSEVVGVEQYAKTVDEFVICNGRSNELGLILDIKG